MKNHRSILASAAMAATMAFAAHSGAKAATAPSAPDPQAAAAPVAQPVLPPGETAYPISGPKEAAWTYVGRMQNDAFWERGNEVAVIEVAVIIDDGREKHFKIDDVGGGKTILRQYEQYYKGFQERKMTVDPDGTTTVLDADPHVRHDWQGNFYDQKITIDANGLVTLSLNGKKPVKVSQGIGSDLISAWRDYDSQRVDIVAAVNHIKVERKAEADAAAADAQKDKDAAVAAAKAKPHKPAKRAKAGAAHTPG